MFIRSLFLASVAITGSAALGAGLDVPTVDQKANMPKVAAKPAANAAMTRAVFSQRVDARFKDIDANHDGVITRQELDAAQQQLNGKVEEVVDQKAEERFKELDTNKDGQLSKAEFMAPLAHRKVVPNGEAAMARLDSNKDGKISADEYRAQSLTTFDKLDVNHDGVLSAVERAGPRRR